MVDFEKTKENLRKIFGDKLDEEIQKVIKAEGCNENIAIYRLGERTPDVEVQVSAVIGSFTPKKISEIKEDVLEDVQELVDAEVKDIDTEMKQKGKWPGIIALSLGLFGKETSYTTKDKITDIQRKVGFIDPTGYLEGTIWKEATIKNLAPLLSAGKVVGLNGIVTTYYHPHKKVAINLNIKTEVIEVNDKVHSGWLRNIEDIEEYDAGIVQISGVGKPKERKYRGCNNPKCPESYKNTKATVCKQCAKETVELITQVYPAECGNGVPDFSIPAWSSFDLKENVDNIVAVRRSDNNGERQYTILAVVDDFVPTQSGEIFHKVATSDEVAPEKTVIDTSDVKVEKKDLVRIRTMIKGVKVLEERQLSGIAKTMALREDDNLSTKVLAKGLDELEEIIKEGSAWKLKNS